jgi:hypothetical protein
VSERDLREELEFGRVLVEAGAFLTPAQVVDYFAAPWTFDRELEVWRELGRPSAIFPGEEGDRFDEFVRLVGAGTEAIREWLLERL